MSDAELKAFADRIMEPMPMIVGSKGPREASRHWDWKAGDGFGIITPVEITTTFKGLEADMIVIDEASSFDEGKWKEKLLGEWDKSLMEGSFTSTEEPVDEVLTVKKLKDAMEKIKETEMPRKIPKKKKVRSDPRKAKYTGRMFGNILLSTTEQILNNTTLNDALFLEGSSGITVEELIAPLFEEFITKHGDEWQVIGPMSLAAQSVESGKWKNVSALGGEILKYHSVVIGKRDGICIKWTTGNIVGLEEEMMIDTTVKGFGDKLVHAKLGGNPANRAHIIDMLLEFSGEADIVTAADEAKERTRVIIAKQLKKDIERKSEAYGEGFGQWA